MNRKSRAVALALSTMTFVGASAFSASATNVTVGVPGVCTYDLYGPTYHVNTLPTPGLERDPNGPQSFGGEFDCPVLEDQG